MSISEHSTGPLRPELRAELERKLSGRLHQLKRSLRSHEVETSTRLPSDDSEAAPLKSEMNIVESEERSESAEIERIERALERLKRGTYGFCQACGQGIPVRRLRAVPESRYCLGCQQSFERGSRENWPY